MNEVAPLLAERLLALFPGLDALPPALSELEGQILFEERARCRGFPMLLAGKVHVARGGAELIVLSAAAFER
jgi:hypothetical protein